MQGLGEQQCHPEGIWIQPGVHFDMAAVGGHKKDGKITKSRPKPLMKTKQAALI